MRILAIVPKYNADYGKCDLCKWEIQRGSPALLREHLIAWHLIIEDAALTEVLGWKRLPPKERIRLEQPQITNNV
jgi:hypothetical protein